MAISKKSDKPAGITNASGEPELVLDIEGLTLSFAPPAKPEPPTAAKDDAHDA